MATDNYFMIRRNRKAQDCKGSNNRQTLMKLQIVERMWNGFDFYYFYLDRIYQSSLRYAPARRIIWNFFACGEGPFGRRPHYPDDPVDPVQLFSL